MCHHSPNFCRAAGPEVFLSELRDFSLLMDSINSSTGVDCFLTTPSFLSAAWKCM